MDPLQEQKVAPPPVRTLKLRRQFRRFFADLGLGLITGAADDDPSGISTYSVTGAAFGNGPLLRLLGWTTAILMTAASVAMFIT